MATTLNFGKLFGKSPFKPVKKHMKIAHDCVERMPTAMDAFLKQDKIKLKDLKHEITQLESDADKIFEELQNRLPKTMFLPVDRRDLLDVLEMQEAIADRTEDIIGLMLELSIDVPKEMRLPMKNLVEHCVSATKGAYDIVASFENLVETGFKGPHVEKTQKLIHEVVSIETEADSIGTDITHALFEHGQDMHPIALVFLYKLIGWIDDLADFSEKLAIRSRLLLAR